MTMRARPWSTCEPATSTLLDASRRGRAGRVQPGCGVVLRTTDTWTEGRPREQGCSLTQRARVHAWQFGGAARCADSPRSNAPRSGTRVHGRADRYVSLAGRARGWDAFRGTRVAGVARGRLARAGRRRSGAVKRPGLDTSESQRLRVKARRHLDSQAVVGVRSAERTRHPAAPDQGADRGAGRAVATAGAPREPCYRPPPSFPAASAAHTMRDRTRLPGGELSRRRGGWKVGR